MINWAGIEYSLNNRNVNMQETAIRLCDSAILQYQRL